MYKLSHCLTLGKNYYSILLGIFLVRGGWFTTLPFIAIYLSINLKYDPILIGFILSSGILASSLFGFFAGYLSDIVGRRKVMLISLIGLSLFFFIFPLVSQPLGFIICNIGIGIFRSGFDAPSNAYITDSVDSEKLPLAFNLRYLLSNISATLGILIGSLAAINSQIKVVFYTSSLLFIVAFIAIIYTTHPRENIAKGERESPNLITTLISLTKSKALFYIVLSMFLIYMLHSQLDSNIPQYLLHNFTNGTKLYATLLIVNTVAVLALQIIVNYYLQQFKMIVSLFLGCVFFSIAYLLFLLCKNQSLLILAMLIYTLGEMILLPLNSIIIDRVAPHDRKGAAFGLSGLSLLGFGVGPLLGGIIISFNSNLFFIVMSLIALVAIISYKLCLRHGKLN